MGAVFEICAVPPHPGPLPWGEGEVLSRDGELDNLELYPVKPMKLQYFEVDAFASKPFHGNPAGICPLERWLDDALMQNIAAENNLSETAFFVPRGDDYELRWFAPSVEIDLCGHATLASASN